MEERITVLKTLQRRARLHRAQLLVAGHFNLGGIRLRNLGTVEAMLDVPVLHMEAGAVLKQAQYPLCCCLLLFKSPASNSHQAVQASCAW
jgi:hypothetical protein